MMVYIQYWFQLDSLRRRTTIAEINTKIKSFSISIRLSLKESKGLTAIEYDNDISYSTKNAYEAYSYLEDNRISTTIKILLIKKKRL